MPKETTKGLRGEIARIQGLYGQERNRATTLSAQLGAVQGQLADAIAEAQLAKNRIQLMHKSHAQETAEYEAIITDQQRQLFSLTAELEGLRRERAEAKRELRSYKRDYGAISLRTMNLWGQMWNHLAIWHGPIGRYAQRFLEQVWENSPEGRQHAARLAKPSRGRR